MATLMTSRPASSRSPVEARNLADLYKLPLLDWARIAERLGQGVTQAPGTGGPDRHTCWLATINQDGSTRRASAHSGSMKPSGSRPESRLGRGRISPAIHAALWALRLTSSISSWKESPSRSRTED